MSTADRPFRWRSVAVVVFLPTIVFSIGLYAMIPVIPALAQNLGADLGGAALIASMVVVGQLLGDIPSGAVVARIGERTAMIAATALALVGVVSMMLAPHPAVLGLGALLIGIAAASFGLARHAFMTSFVPLQFRARALSTLGGSVRLGAVIGPLTGAGLLTLTGEPHSVLWMLAASCVLASTLLIVLRDPEEGLVTRAASLPRAGAIEVDAEARGLWRTIAAKRNVLLTLGTGSAILSGLRQLRQVVLPVWAISIGLDAATASLIIGIAGAVDFSLFFLGGWIMDRFGRLWTILPCALGLSVGFIALAMTHDLDQRVGWFIGIALFLALSNGIGSGILMTLAADLADRRNPAPFLGAWRFTTDLGGAAAPILVTAITAVVSLSVGVAAVGALGLVSALLMRIYVPRYVAARPSQARPGQGGDGS